MKMSLNDLRKKIEVVDFFSSEGIINSELLNDVGTNNVKEIATLLSERIEDPTEKDRRGKIVIHSNELKINQIRKFYDAFLNVYNAKVPSMDEKKVRLLMLKSNAEYSANRLKVKTLELFMKNRLDIVLKQKTKESFDKYLKAYKLHFEALVGYFPKN